MPTKQRKTENYQDADHSILPHWTRLEKIKTDYGAYIKGLIFTPHGIVEAYSDYDHTALFFVANGRCHSRRWPHGFQQRTLVTLAKRFARDVSGEPPPTAEYWLQRWRMEES